MIRRLKSLDINWQRIWIRLGILVVAALALTFFLEYRYFINDFGRAWAFMLERPLVFLYNSLLMFLILLLFAGIFIKPFTGVGVVAGIVMGLTYAHINKFVLRGTPLLPEDIQLASEASAMSKFIDWDSLVRLVLAIILTLILVQLLNYLTRHWWQPTKDEQREIRWLTRLAGKGWWRRKHLSIRIIMILVALLGFVTLTDFARHHTGQRYEDIPWLKSQFVAWNQVRNYDYNGFILGFLYNWSKFNLAVPDGYSAERMNEIAKKYQALKKSDAERTSLNEVDYNLVIILNESFYDPEIIADYYPHEGGEIIPNTRRLMEQYPSGYMYSTDYGGGTANIEFEVLTGLSNYWANTVPYTDLIPRIGEVPAVGNYTKDFGYQTTAIHPFNGGMYKRNIALANEGFDTFITELEMDFTESDGASQYINDRSAYNQVLKTLRDNKKKQAIALVTMQNHTPYDQIIYDQHQFKALGLEGMEWETLVVETYFDLLHHSDYYLGEFVSELETMNEKTVVLFFGDHSPGIFYKVNDNEDKAVRDLARLTPYFVYANFDLPKVSLPTTTPNCLTNTLYDVLNVAKPDYFYLLDRICTETPILAPSYFGEEAPFQSTELSEYELLNYDALGGKKYWH